MRKNILIYLSLIVELLIVLGCVFSMFRPYILNCEYQTMEKPRNPAGLR